MQNEGKKSKTPHTKIISVGMGRRRRKKRFACVINVRPAAAAATLYSIQETKRHLYSYIFTAGDGGEVVQNGRMHYILHNRARHRVNPCRNATARHYDYAHPLALGRRFR